MAGKVFLRLSVVAFLWALAINVAHAQVTPETSPIVSWRC